MRFYIVYNLIFHNMSGFASSPPHGGRSNTIPGDPDTFKILQNIDFSVGFCVEEST